MHILLTNYKKLIKVNNTQLNLLEITMERDAKFKIGEIVKHRFLSFRGVIFDVDPTFNNTEEWWLSIPEDIRPKKDQPFYHLLAENEVTEYVAYVSEQNLLYDDPGEPVRHPQVTEIFGTFKKWLLRNSVK